MMKKIVAAVTAAEVKAIIVSSKEKETPRRNSMVIVT